MNDYERLLSKIYLEVPVIESDLTTLNDDAFFYRGVIYIEKKLENLRKRELLYEEYAHSKYTVGDIGNQNDPHNRKEEYLARAKGMLMAVTLDDILSSYKNGYKEYWEVAEYLGFSPEYLYQAVQEIKRYYGLMITYKNYILRFINEHTLSVERRFP